MPRLSEDPETVKFCLFDLLNYPDYDPQAYDPLTAHQKYQEHLAHWAEADELGFDGIFLGEHHFDAFSVLPSPHIMLAALAARTTRIRLGTMVEVMPFHHPVRLAEEAGMLDVLSGGRLELGIGRGASGFEYSRFHIDMSTTRERFDEGMRVIDAALNNIEFRFNGAYTQAGPATLYPRPIQQPLPIWVTGENPASIEWAAEQGYNLATGQAPASVLRERLERYFEHAHTAGYHRTGANTILQSQCFVAPTDAEAERIGSIAATEHAELLGRVRAAQDLSVMPEGESYAVQRQKMSGWKTPPTFKQMLESGTTFCGSPQTVRDQVQELLNTTGTRRLLMTIYVGDMAPDEVRQTLVLFAREVAPHVRRVAAVV